MSKSKFFRFIIGISLVIWIGGIAFPIENMPLEEMSIKAGPTAAGEELSLLWVESFVYPKALKAGEALNLGVRLAGKIKAVKASFDFTPEVVSLQSENDFVWDGRYSLSSEVSAGLHQVQYLIQGEKGFIQRKLEFFVEKKGEEISAKTEEKVEEFPSGWQLTVSSTSAVYVNGGMRTLQKGEKIIARAKVPFYRIAFGDGKESWISADRVADPSAEYYFLGYEAYKKKDFRSAVKNYKDALALNPELSKAYFWLAKSYYALRDFSAGYVYLKKFLKREERSLEGRILSADLAPKLFVLAQKSFKKGEYSKAIQAYQKVVDLKPSSLAAWRQLGEAYKNLGFQTEAELAFKEAEKTVSKPEQEKLPTPETPTLSSQDPIAIVKESLTAKGTAIERALNSVISLTRSLGSQIRELGWQAEEKDKNFLISYLCEQSDGKRETFQWLVSFDTRIATAHNQNAKLLVERW